MQTSISTLSTFTTDGLVCLAVPLEAVLIGLVTPGTTEYLELVDTDLLAAVREALNFIEDAELLANLGLTEEEEIIDAIQEELEARHPEIAAAMRARESQAAPSTSWSTDLLEAADEVRKREHDRLDRLGAVTAFTYFMNP